MCIEYSKEKHELSKEAQENLKNRVGYKLLNKSGKEFTAICYSYTYKRNKWMTDDKDYDLDFDRHRIDCYQTGFHIFLTRENHITWGFDVMYKVEFKNITAIGLQYGEEVVVAREMIIKEEVK